MPHYQVVVGNIGTVYDGPNPLLAYKSFLEYITLSESPYGRAAGEPVTEFKDGEIIREHEGTVSDG